MHTHGVKDYKEPIIPTSWNEPQLCTKECETHTNLHWRPTHKITKIHKKKKKHGFISNGTRERAFRKWVLGRISPSSRSYPYPRVPRLGKEIRGQVGGPPRQPIKENPARPSPSLLHVFCSSSLLCSLHFAYFSSIARGWFLTPTRASDLHTHALESSQCVSARWTLCGLLHCRFRCRIWCGTWGGWDGGCEVAGFFFSYIFSGQQRCGREWVSGKLAGAWVECAPVAQRGCFFNGVLLRRPASAEFSC